MKTNILTAHEEEYSNKSKTLGILLIIGMDGKRVDSLVYIYRQGMYIFFTTIMDMNDYLLYGEGKMKRAYMEEEEFDEFYDASSIDGNFTDILKWT